MVINVAFKVTRQTTMGRLSEEGNTIVEGSRTLITDSAEMAEKAVRKIFVEKYPGHNVVVSSRVVAIRR